MTCSRFSFVDPTTALKSQESPTELSPAGYRKPLSFLSNFLASSVGV
jgi:hypothetical protein